MPKISCERRMSAVFAPAMDMSRPLTIDYCARAPLARPNWRAPRLARSRLHSRAAAAARARARTRRVLSLCCATLESLLVARAARKDGRERSSRVVRFNGVS